MALNRPRAKVTVSLEITALVDVTDSGYLGVDASIAEHLDKARNDARSWRVLIQQGGLEPKPVNASMRVKYVHIVPEETP